MSDVTRILESIEQGDPNAADKLLPLVYDELRKLAAARMANEPPNQTLQPTALVHEAWLRLVCAGFLTHYMSPPWVLRLMLGTLLVVMVAFLFVREPAIDAMPHRKLGKLTFRGNFWEAITAHSRRPAYPAEIGVSHERERTSV